MPSSIYYNGQRRYRPGVYSKVITQSSNTGLSIGNVAIVGDFPVLEQNKVHTFTAYDDLVAATRSKNDTADIASLAFNPLKSEASTITSLTLVNARSTVAAYNDNQGLRISSRLYGDVGRQLSTTLSQNANNKYKLVVIEGGQAVETLDNLGEGADIASLKYDGAFFDASSMEVTATNFKVTVQKDLANAGIVDQTEAIGKSCEGLVRFKCLSNQGGADVDMTITGLDATGAPQTEVVTIGNTLLADETVSSTNVFSYVTSLAWDVNSFDGDAELSFEMIDRALTDISDVEGLLNEIVMKDSDFVIVSPSVTTKGEDLDRLSVASIQAAVVGLTTDLSDVITAITNGSAYVTASKQNNEKMSIFENSDLRLGSEGTSIASSDWDNAFDALVHKDINTVVPWTNAVDTHIKVKAHCLKASTDAGMERNAFVGAAPAQTLLQVHNTHSKVLNDRNVAVCAQGLTFIDNNNKEITKTEPYWMALVLACVQGATPVAEPMTRKEPRIIKTSQAFNAEQDVDDAIKKGIIVLGNPGSIGIRIERSVTTFQNANPVYSEVSANESLNTSVKDLRAQLEKMIGGKVTADSEGLVLQRAIKRLNFQKAEGVIKDFKNVRSTSAGDTMNIIYDVAVIEPLNFITTTANVAQF